MTMPEPPGGQPYDQGQGAAGPPYYPPPPAGPQFQAPPQFHPGPYQPNAYAYAPYPQAPSTNGMAIASMVLGILWVYWIGSILALIFGYVARDQIKRSGQSGDGMAIAGIVLGWVGVGFLVIGLAFWGSYWWS